MKRSEKSDKSAEMFAKLNDFDGVKYVGPYKEWLAYYAKSKALDGTIYGVPACVLVREDMGCRFTSVDEAMNIMSSHMPGN